MDISYSISSNKILNPETLSSHSSSSLSKSSEKKFELHEAVKTLDKTLDQIKVLLNSGDFSINDKNEKNETPLSLAVDAGDLDFIRLIIALGANINQELTLNETVLHRAVKNLDLQVTELLLTKGADINTVQAWSYFFATGAPLHLAISKNSLSLVQILIKFNADPNLRNEWGETPLHLAAYYGCSEEIIDYLVQSGAHVHRLNGLNSWTASGSPLHVAAERSSPTVIAALIKNGADINSLNEKDESPISVAVQKSSLRSFKELLKYDPDLTLKNETGETLLDIAEKKLQEGGNNAKVIFEMLDALML